MNGNTGRSALESLESLESLEMRVHPQCSIKMIIHADSKFCPSEKLWY
ncbi:hypothetical protein HVY96_13900 [Escherichia fergusonii]|nr:hypothetical protein [Escherichia fergusonii]EHG6171210.1 hypothetical protein [Escherichia fergusonii]EIH2135156.1 hypothetical protein [Escherichia fergusonii]EIH2154701.1 hypothetical protein [Escherichia fergusonii]EIH9410116.1 hypothetical protein [Escherichia fergusonii]EIH9431607.1 hypothetical protein [Escherichia fergusonii]